MEEENNVRKCKGGGEREVGRTRKREIWDVRRKKKVWGWGGWKWKGHQHSRSKEYGEGQVDEAGGRSKV